MIVLHISKCTVTVLPGMASIPSAAFVFDQDLGSSKILWRLLSYSGDTFAESGLLCL